MKSKKFESFDAAKSYMESKGVLKFWGRVGDNDLENGVYSLTIGIKMYHLFLRDDGTVIVNDVTYISPT